MRIVSPAGPSESADRPYARSERLGRARAERVASEPSRIDRRTRRLRLRFTRRRSPVTDWA